MVCHPLPWDSTSKIRSSTAACGTSWECHSTAPVIAAQSAVAQRTPLETTRWGVEATGTGLLTTTPTATSAALAPTREAPSVVPDSQSRLADILLPTWSRGRPAALDVTVISPLQQQTLHAAASTPGHALQVGIQRKLTAHLSLPLRRGGIHSNRVGDSGRIGRGHHHHHSMQQEGHGTESDPPGLLHLPKIPFSPSGDCPV